MSAVFSIGKRSVGGDAPVFVIAELSANHAGRLDIALRTIEAAAKAGADAIKLQTYTPDTLTLRSDAEPFVVRTKNVWAGRTLHDLYAEAMTPWEWHAELRDAALSLGMEWLSTPFDPTAVRLLEDLGAPAHKVASFEIVDTALIENVAATGKPLIISTGMATLGEIEAALAACRAMGNENVALLRCVSSYPARPETMFLQSLRVLADLAPVIGLSDHTRDSTAAIAAIALGARIVEKHFIVDRSVGGPDAFFSLEPDEFRALVSAVRAAERASAGPRFGPSEDELASLAFRRSLFVARDVKKGAILTCDDVRSVRPANGLPARYLPSVLGRAASRDLSAASPLDWADVADRPASPSVTLRPASLEDESLLLAWRNDDLTRRMSRNTEAVTNEDHAAWLRASLAMPSRALFIAVERDIAVGQIRLDFESSARTQVSITVAPTERGRGQGLRMLLAAEAVARRRGAARLVATIRADNLASVRAFKSAGYYAFVERTEAGARYLDCERSLRDPR